TRPALRHRSGRSRQVGHTRARPPVLGLCLPQLELPSRASLLCRRAVLPAPCAAAGARSLLHAPRRSVADVLRPALRVVRRESRAAHELGRAGVGAGRDGARAPLITSNTEPTESTDKIR